MISKSRMESRVIAAIFPASILYFVGATLFFVGVAVYNKSLFAGFCALGTMWPLGALLRHTHKT